MNGAGTVGGRQAAASPAGGGGRAVAACAGALLLLTLVAFAPVRHNGFVLADDDAYIVENPAVAQGVTARGVRLAFTGYYAANWHPLTWLSHMLDVELFGLDPRGHHAVNVALHAASSLLLMLTLRAMTGRIAPAFFAAALFALHPLRVESVAWASERKDVLSAFFWVLACALYLRYARRPGGARYCAVLAAFAVGLTAKQMLVTLPFVLLALDWWPLNRFPRPAGDPARRWRARAALVREKLPLLALAFAAAIVALQTQSKGGAMAAAAVYPLEARLANAGVSTVRYLGLAAWPAGLAVFYPYVLRPLLAPAALAAAALLAATSAAALAWRRRAPWVLAGWSWYLVTLLPVIGLVQIGEQAMADRYTYLPLVGVFLAACWGAAAAVPRGRSTAPALAAVIALLCLVGMTRRQVATWRDDLSLFGHAVAVTRDNSKALHSLALARAAAGDREGALRSHREAARVEPAFFTRSRYGYALALAEAGRRGEAIELLRGVVAASPREALERMQLALLLAAEGHDDEAAGHLRELIRQQPSLAAAYNNLAVILARRGETVEAVALLRQALALDPAYADARANLAALEAEASP